MPDGMDFLYRPVERGWCTASALNDPAYSLADFAEWNDALDVIDENRARHDEWMNRHARP